jgi:Lar family restriction alleviation protein
MQQGGGEVWRDKKQVAHINTDGTGWSSIDYQLFEETCYTVRPLPPVLLPCPFCGGKEMIIQECYGHYVFCKTCYAYTAKKIDKDEAVNAWNRREGSGA